MNRKGLFFWHLAAMMILLLYTSGCRSLKVGQIVTGDEENWVTEGESSLRGNEIPSEIAPPLEEIWTYNAMAGFGPGSPLLIGDIVLVANRKGEVHAIDFETGKRLGLEKFGDSIEGTPVVNGDMLYIPVAWRSGSVTAYDLSAGKTIWKVKHDPVEAGLLLHRGTLFSVDVNGTLRAYHIGTGKIKWERALGERNGFHAAPIGVDETIIVADDQGQVSAVRAVDGTLHWTQSLRIPVYSTPGSNQTDIFIPTTSGVFVSLNAETGEERWRYSVSDSLVSFSSPAVGEHEIVFGGSDGMLHALDPSTGESRWTFTVDEALLAAPLITQDAVYVGGMGQKLYALDRESGRELWNVELEGRIKSALAGREGYLIVLAEPRVVYLFGGKERDYVSDL